MSRDLEIASRRVVEGLRGQASAMRDSARSEWTPAEVDASDERRAALLEEIAGWLAEPLAAIDESRSHQKHRRAA